MSKIIMTGGGEAVDLDVITAAASDVKSGKVIVDKDGNPINGTMAAVAGRTVTPGKANQTVISAGQWASGNIVVAGDADLIAANIKKGVNLFGVTGTFEGYVPSNNDLYLRGNNIAGWTDYSASTTIASRFESGAIYVHGSSTPSLRLYTTKTYNLNGYTKLNLELSALLYDNSDGSPDGYFQISLTEGNSFSSTSVLASYETYDISSNYSAGGTYWNHKTISIDLTNINRTIPIGLYYNGFKIYGAESIAANDKYNFENDYPIYIYRIWLS